MPRLLVGLVAGTLLLVPAAGGQPRAVVVIDPGHDLRANGETEPIGPRSCMRKIKDGGGATGSSRVARGRVQPEGRAAATRAAGEGRRQGRHDADPNREGLDGKHRPRADREPRRRGLFLRIHADGSTDRSARGTHTLDPALRRAGRTTSMGTSNRAGRIVQAGLPPALGFADHGLQERSDFTGFNWADVPVILVELGYLRTRTRIACSRLRPISAGPRGASAGGRFATSVAHPTPAARAGTADRG